MLRQAANGGRESAERDTERSNLSVISQRIFGVLSAARQYSSSSHSHNPTPSLRQYDIPPDIREKTVENLPELLAASDLSKPAFLLKRKARLVFAKDVALECPDT